MNAISGRAGADATGRPDLQHRSADQLWTLCLRCVRGLPPLVGFFLIAGGVNNNNPNTDTSKNRMEQKNKFKGEIIRSGPHRSDRTAHHPPPGCLTTALFDMSEPIWERSQVPAS
jgi:hypothetical protein